MIRGSRMENSSWPGDRPTSRAPTPPELTSTFPTRARRPGNSRMVDTRNLREAFGLTLPPWQASVEHMLTECSAHHDHDDGADGAAAGTCYFGFARRRFRMAARALDSSPLSLRAPSIAKSHRSAPLS